MYVHLVAVLVFCSIFSYRLLKWILYQFGGVTSDQVLFHVFATTIGTPASITKKLIFEAGIKPLAGVIVFYALIFFFKKFKNIHRLIVISVAVLSCAILASTAIKTSRMISGPGVEAEFKEKYKNVDWLESFYKEPEVLVAPKYNLVWIYFESLESRYVDHNNFPTNSDRDITSDFRSLNGTGWTVAGILSSQCGVPLVLDPLSPSGNSKRLSDTACLPDLLNNYGYNGYFTSGSVSRFQDRDAFLRPHGINQITGKEEIEKIIPDAPPSATKYWGYSDDYVLKIIEDEVIKLHARGEKFNYLSLTSDTHGPLIYTEFCEKNGFKNSEKDIFACGLKRINTLINNWAKAGVLKNTTVVVSGDHPAMRTYHYDWWKIHKEKSFVRESVFVYIRPADQFSTFENKLHTKSMNHFDLMPTVFYALGGELKDNRGGLGFNVLKASSLNEMFTEDELNYLLSKRSEAYEVRAGRR